MNKRRPFRFVGAALAFPLSIFACSLVKAEELKCAGAFAPGTDHARIVAAFGAKNVVHETVPAEGEDVQVTAVFPNDPARRIEILWSDEAAGRNLAALRVRGSFWSVRGLRVGASLTDVEKANGKPFALYGFGWDLGGQIQDWNGGAMALPAGRCRVVVVFETGREAPVEAHEAVEINTGKREFRSDFRAMRVVNPTVRILALVTH